MSITFESLGPLHRDVLIELVSAKEDRSASQIAIRVLGTSTPVQRVKAGKALKALEVRGLAVCRDPDATVKMWAPTGEGVALVPSVDVKVDWVKAERLALEAFAPNETAVAFRSKHGSNGLLYRLWLQTAAPGNVVVEMVSEVDSTYEHGLFMNLNLGSGVPATVCWDVREFTSAEGLIAELRWMTDMAALLRRQSETMAPRKC